MEEMTPLKALEEIRNKLLKTERNVGGGITTYGSIHDAYCLDIIEKALNQLETLKKYICGELK